MFFLTAVFPIFALFHKHWSFLYSENMAFFAALTVTVDLNRKFDLFIH